MVDCGPMRVSQLIGAVLAMVLSAACPKPESTRENTSDLARPFVSETALGTHEPSLAEQALTRCEAAGDAYEESKEAWESAVANHEGARSAAMERLAQETGLAALEADYQRLEQELSVIREEVSRIQEEAGVRWREGPGSVFYPHDKKEVIEAWAREDAANEHANVMFNALSAMKNNVQARVNAETDHLRLEAEQRERRMTLDGELLGRTIQEANMLREPGGPLCSWQFE